MDILVNGDNHKVSNVVFSLLGCLPKVQDIAVVTASLLLQLTLLAEATITCSLVIPLLYAAFR